MLPTSFLVGCNNAQQIDSTNAQLIELQTQINELQSNIDKLQSNIDEQHPDVNAIYFGSTIDPNRPQKTYTEKINNVTWQIRVYEDTKEVIALDGKYRYNDTSSELYKQLSEKYNTTGFPVQCDYILKGVPLGKNWYKIECIELLSYSDLNDNHFTQKRVFRYEEYFEFSSF